MNRFFSALGIVAPLALAACATAAPDTETDTATEQTATPDDAEQARLWAEFEKHEAKAGNAGVKPSAMIVSNGFICVDLSPDLGVCCSRAQNRCVYY